MSLLVLPRSLGAPLRHPTFCCLVVLICLGVISRVARAADLTPSRQSFHYRTDINCQALLEFERKLRQLPSPLDLVATMAPLGEGEHAVARVIRTIDDGEVVVKFYKEDARQQARLDFEGLQFLRAHQEHFPFRVARPIQYLGDLLFMELAQGQNLDALMKDPERSDIEKSEVRARYLDALKQTLEFFDSLGFDYQLRSQPVGFGKATLAIPHAVHARKELEDGTFYEFIIKSDNILVDQLNSRLTIVDPY